MEMSRKSQENSHTTGLYTILLDKRGPLLRTASCVFVKRKPNGLTATAAKPFTPRYAPESHQYINLLMKYYRLISLLFFFDKEIHLQEYIVKSFVVVGMQVYRVSVKILPYQLTVLFLKYLQRYVYRILFLFKHSPAIL